VLVDNNQNYVKGRGSELTRPVIGEGLLTSEGDFHQRQRRLMQPAFHRRQIATLAQHFCFHLAPSVRVEPQPLVTLRPKYGLPVTLHQYDEKLALALI
jgi:hypothetical protein